MSGAQGAQPPGSYTATTYESTETGENKTKLDIHSKEDEGGIQIEKLQDKVEDAAGQGGPVFGAGAGEEEQEQEQEQEQEKKDDLGVSGTA